MSFLSLLCNPKAVLDDLDLKMFKTGHSCSVSLNTHTIQRMMFRPHQIHYPLGAGAPARGFT